MEQDRPDSERVTQDGGVEGKAAKWWRESGRGEQEDNMSAGNQLRQRRQIPSMEGELFTLSSHTKPTRAHPVDKAQAW